MRIALRLLPLTLLTSTIACGFIWDRVAAKPEEEDDGSVVPPRPGAQLAQEESEQSSTRRVESHLSRADKLTDEGNPSEALLELQEAARRLLPGDRRMVGVYQRMGRVYLEENDRAAARDAFTRGIKLAKELNLKNDDAAFLFLGMGRLLLSERKPSYAEKFLKKALESGPSEPTRKLIEAELEKAENSGR